MATSSKDPAKTPGADDARQQAIRCLETVSTILNDRGGVRVDEALRLLQLAATHLEQAVDAAVSRRSA